MLKPLHADDRGILAGSPGSPVRHPIEVVVGGHRLRATRAMGELFLKAARVNARNAGAPLTPLSHSEGVELLHITAATPVTVSDVGRADGIALILWRWPEPAPAADTPAEAADRPGDRPEDRLLALFDAPDEWLGRDAGAEHLAAVRSLIAGLAEDAGLREPEEFAYSWHILMEGAVVDAAEGDAEAAHRAKAMGRDLIARHRRGAAQADAGDHRVDPRWALG